MDFPGRRFGDPRSQVRAPVATKLMKAICPRAKAGVSGVSMKAETGTCPHKNMMAHLYTSKHAHAPGRPWLTHPVLALGSDLCSELIASHQRPLGRRQPTACRNAHSERVVPGAYRV
jgi:hypothetical protein